MRIEIFVRKNGGINPENLIPVKTYSEQSTVRESWKVALKRQWNSFETIIVVVKHITLCAIPSPKNNEKRVLKGCVHPFWIGARDCKVKARLKFYTNCSRSLISNAKFTLRKSLLYDLKVSDLGVFKVKTFHKKVGGL